MIDKIEKTKTKLIMTCPKDLQAEAKDEAWLNNLYILYIYTITKSTFDVLNICSYESYGIL